MLNLVAEERRSGDGMAVVTTTSETEVLLGCEVIDEETECEDTCHDEDDQQQQ